MKKQVSVMTVIILCVISLVIGAALAMWAMDEWLESRGPLMPPMTQGNTPPGDIPSTQNGQPANSEQLIGEDRAKEIALEKARLTADKVRFDRVELEHEKGAWYYEIEFRKDLTEYSADISATDGTILSWEVEPID